MRNGLVWVRRRTAVAAAAVRASVDVGDVTLVIGLVLLGRGCWLLHPAAGCIVPGAILVWWALPQRPAFVEPSPANKRPKGE